MSYTKGEWIVKDSETKTAYNVIGTALGGKYKIARSPYCVDTRGYSYDKKEALDNAKLISAAPDLLESLKRFIAFADKYKRDYESSMVEQAKAAIKKATS